MRAIPAVALTAAVPIGYLAFRRLIGNRAALVAAAILAVNPMLVSYATDARSYGLFVLTALLSMWAFAALLESATTRRFALWAVASIACVWTHYFGVFVIGAEVVLLLVSRPDSRRAIVAWSVGVGACLTPLIPLVAGQSGDERAGFIEQRSLISRLAEAGRQFAMGPNVPRNWLEGAGLVVVWLAVVMGVWWAARSHERVRLLAVLTVLVGGAPLLLSVTGIVDRFYARNLIVVVPLIAALAAPVMLRWRASPLAVYLLLATATSVWVATDWRYEQADWKGALARAETIDPSASVVAVPPLDAPVVQTYLARPPLTQPRILAQQAWLIVEPVRAAGHRALGPAPVPALPGFSVQRIVDVHGFQLFLEHASQPTPLRPTTIVGATIFPGRGDGG
jgi:4-amino-4-deoxy-L-arabinose transferase-like glycosyltransferase